MRDPLTTSQVRAVEHTGGPLIVLAGPGTGKTRTIINRVAHQADRGVPPETIVALTFTAKAAGQLRERLAQLTTALMAERVNISTIHAFGHRLVRRFSDVLGLPADLQLIDAAQSSRLLKEIVLGHGLFTASRGEGLGSLVHTLDGVFAGVANRGLAAKACVDFAHAWGARLERGPGPGADPLAHEAEKAQHAHFSDAMLALNLFTAERWKRGWVTFDDFLTLPLRLLREHPTAAAICRGDYRAFVVDEFQDCNPAQIELLHLLAPPEGNPDLCVVGDDDQAIYRFRGADEQAFKRFADIWKNYTLITLTENYRSQPPIIAAANAVIEAAQVRFKNDKVIAFPSASTPLAACDCGVEGVRLEDEYQDPEVITAMIVADRAATAQAGHARQWGKYAVVARSHLELDRTAAALRIEGIPYARSKDGSPLDDAGVEDVLAWVQWLVDPAATWAARRILTRPPFGLPPAEVLGWEQEFKAQASHAAAGREGVAAPGRFDAWVRVRGAGTPAALRCMELYDTLQQETATLRGDEGLFRVMMATDAAHAELLPGRERAERVSALVALLSLARDKQSRLAPPGDLAEFWAYFNELRDAGSDGAVQGLAQLSDPAPSGDGDTEGRVQLLTAHAAKGLEFDTVFVQKVKAPNGFPKSRGDGSWQPPAGLFDCMDTREEAERCADEERRLFYVACTRAERRLVLLSKPNKTVTKTTNFFDEVTRGGLIVTVRDAADVLAQAAGAGAAARSAIEASGMDFKSRAAAREVADKARREARLAAAQALELVDRSDAEPAHLREAAENLKRAAEQIALVAAAERAGTPPAWLIEQRPDLLPLAQRIDAMLKRDAAEDAAPTSLLVKPMPPPLRLSYSTIDSYNRCARCFYLSRVMGLPEPDSDETTVGTIAHEVLKGFYERWGRADADGLPRPGVDSLVAMARQALVASLGSRQEVSKEMLEQLTAQMRLMFANLHQPDAHVLELERTIDFEYPLDGLTHRFTAKLDRIDLLPDGGVRVIDYKTGYAAQRYLEPKRDDLQLGIYALALKLGKGLSWAADGVVQGTAEYWCLSTGCRGAISLTDIDEAKVRTKVDKAVRAMLKGEFPRAKGCTGPCGLLGD